MKFARLILATNNEHKIKEMSAVLADLSIGILSKADFPDFPDIPETGATLEENALIKARTVFQRYRIPAVADDTGLEVKHLGGAPGVLSARFAGEGCSFEDNNRLLLSKLKGVPVAERGARFVTVLGVAYEGGETTVSGAVDGYITTEFRGRNGFGYDPIFLYPPLSKTYAEMTPEEKNSVSHRGRALRAFREWLLSA